MSEMNSGFPASLLPVKVSGVLAEATEYFQGKGIPSARNESEWLMMSLLNCSRSSLLIKSDRSLTIRQAELFHSWLALRSSGIPPQYIVGETEFYGRVFKVDSRVMIPRPETERLVDVSLHILSKFENPCVLDIGTGSGCIAVAIAHECQRASLTAVDVSSSALDVASENAQMNHTDNIHFIQMNILQEKPQSQFDLVVSNPPYISADEFSGLIPKVRDTEPRKALTDEKEGLTFYRRFAEIAPYILVPGGWLVMEVGLDAHPQKVGEFFGHPMFSDQEFVSDYNGDERVLKVQLNG